MTTARMRAIPTIVEHLQRFIKDKAILAELLHLKESPTSMGPGSGCGLRSSCGVGYAIRGWRPHSFAIAAGASEDDGSHGGLPSLHPNRI